MMERITGAIIRARFKKPVKDISATSPGGYRVKAKDGAEYAFDFNLSHGNVVKSRVVDYEVKAPDFTSFPEMSRLPEQLKNVVEFTECYVWCEDPDQEVKKIEAFCLELSGTGPITSEIMERYRSTEYITSEIICGKADYLIRCHFTKKLLDTCKSDPEG